MSEIFDVFVALSFCVLLIFLLICFETCFYDVQMMRCQNKQLKLYENLYEKTKKRRHPTE